MRGALRVLLAKPFVGPLSRRRRDGDRALDRQVAGVLELQRLLRYPAVESMDPPRARRFIESGLSPLEVAPIAMDEVIDTTAGSIPIRIYVPANVGRNWIVYLHGGGGVTGSVRSSEPIVRYIAAHTRSTVASVDYRCGPENKHPAAIDDACAAWQAIVTRVPAGGKIGVAGDSFGGFLSAHVDHAIRARSNVRPPDLQVLIYPMVDLTMSAPSVERYAEGYLLTRALMHWYRGHYMHDDDDRRAASPQYWPSVRGAAPAIVATAGFDPLVDEGDGYVAKLRAAGVPVTHRRYPSLVHGFLSLAGGVRTARAATDELCADVVELLG
jgi:acetyl esterase